MDALQFISLFEDFQTQSSRNFIDELEKAFEIGGIVEDKWKKFLFKMKLSGICRQWYYNEYDHFDQEEYKKLKWVDVKKGFYQLSIYLVMRIRVRKERKTIKSVLLKRIIKRMSGK